MISAILKAAKVAAAWTAKHPEIVVTAVWKTWDYFRQSKTDDPPRDGDGGPDAFLKEDRRKPPGPLSAPPH